MSDTTNMGKVFSPEQVYAGHIPEAGAHLSAARLLVNEILDGEVFRSFPEEFIESGIDSGLVHGSVTHGTANMRSDLDVLLIQRPQRDNDDTLLKVASVFGRIASDLHVPVESNILTMEDALRRNHKIDVIFLEYLQRAEQNPTMTKATNPRTEKAQGEN